MKERETPSKRKLNKGIKIKIANDRVNVGKILPNSSRCFFAYRFKKYIDATPNSFIQEIFDIKDLPKGIYLININSDKSILRPQINVSFQPFGETASFDISKTAHTS